MARLVLALTTALLGLAMVTAAATADPSTPPASSEAPPPSSESSPPPSEESSVPPSSESSPPPSNEPADEETKLADIAVTAAFGKPSYVTAEEMTITLTVRNTGTEPVELTAYFPHGMTDDGIVVTATSTWDANEALTLAAGESVTNVLTGVAVNPKEDSATLHVSVSSGGTKESFAFSVPVTPRTATVSGAVFEDRNGNGNPDNGEGVSDATLTFTNKLNDFYRVTTETNEDGEFSLDVSPGTYDVRGDAYSYVVLGHSVTVPESGVDGVLFKTLRKLRDLAVDMKFTKGTYKPDETPTVRVTLTNKGDVPLSGILANCYAYEDGPELTGKGAGWGSLASGGATVAPHASTVVTVTEPMPARAHDYGYVSIDCYFTYAGVWDNENPRAAAYASVPGKTAGLSGEVGTFVEGADMSGFRIVLTSVDGCPIVADTLTGADGKYSIKGVPAGRYYVYLVLKSGWDFKLSGLPLSPVSLVAGQENTRSWWLYPFSGTSAAPKPPVCPGGDGANPPAPQGSAGTGLAYTGASLLVPGIAGLLVLLAGIGAVLVSRRRKSVDS